MNARKTQLHNKNGVLLWPETDLDSVVGLKEVITEIKDEVGMSTWSFMCRAHGSPDPDAVRWYGDTSNIDVILSHIHMGWFKKRGDWTQCAPGRISLDVDGNDIPIDGSLGDLCVYWDRELHWYSETVEVSDGVTYDIYGLGFTSRTLFGKPSHVIARSAFFVDDAQILNDSSRCAFNPDWTPTILSQHLPKENNVKPATITVGGTEIRVLQDDYRENVTRTVRTTGISALNAITYSDHKNEDNKTRSEGWYSMFFRVYETFLKMLFMEQGSVNTNDLNTGFGWGLTRVSRLNNSTWSSNAGTSGWRLVDADRNLIAYGNLVATTETEICTGVNVLDQLGVGPNGLISMLEPQRVLDRITANGWTADVGRTDVLFTWKNAACKELVRVPEYDEEGNKNWNLHTGKGLDPNRPYYMIRDVYSPVDGGDGTHKKLAGISDGVMTGIVIKFTFE